MPAKSDFAMVPAVIAPTPAPMLPRKEMTFQDLWGILSRRRGIVLWVLLLTMAATAVVFALSTRLYNGSAQIQVQKEAADALSMDTMMGPGAQSDATDLNITLQTQAQILQSESLALQVIKELNLEKSPDFQAHFSPIGWVMGLFAPCRYSGSSQCAAGRGARPTHAGAQDLCIPAQGEARPQHSTD